MAKKKTAKIKTWDVEVSAVVTVACSLSIEAASEEEAYSKVEQMIEDDLFDPFTAGLSPSKKGEEAGITFGDIDAEHTIDSVDSEDDQ